MTTTTTTSARTTTSLLEEGTQQQQHQPHNHLEEEQHQHQHQQQHQTMRSRVVRSKLLVSALALCAVGFWCQILNLQDLQETNNPSWSEDHKREQQMMTNDHHLKGDLYVPSVDFLVDGQSLYSPAGNTRQKRKKNRAEKVDCSKPVKELQWEWFNNNNKDTDAGAAAAQKKNQDNRHLKQAPRLLIGLTSGFDKYAELLTHSAYIAKVYAQAHNAAVVVVQGMAFAPKGCTPPAVHASLNKIRLLFHAIDHRDQYDQILLLDTDAVLVNMDFNVTDLIADSKTLLAAQPVRQADGTTATTPLPPHKINAGATLWNLQHRDIKTVALEWFQAAKTAVLKGTYQGDQRFLQGALEQYKGTPTGNVRLLQDEFAYAEGTVVQHFLQPSVMSWNDRKAKVQGAVAKVCQQHPDECAAVPKVEYATL